MILIFSYFRSFWKRKNGRIKI